VTSRPDASETPFTAGDVARIAREVVAEVERAVVGKRETIEPVLICVLAGGHVLLEDVPGLAKTLIVRSLARVLGLETSRIQFTPDLMPADVTGSGVFDQRHGS
jgi:MoxR-like ATPase